jgi:hypothetical protein
MSEREQGGRNGNPFAPIPERFADATRKVSESLTYPVDSKAAMAEQLGGLDELLQVGEENAPVRIWLMFLPACCFPIASPENFAEKVAEVAAARNPSPRSEQSSHQTLRAAADAFLHDREVAGIAARVLSTALAAEVAPERMHEALEALARDERSLQVLVRAVGRVSDVRPADATRSA